MTIARSDENRMITLKINHIMLKINHNAGNKSSDKRWIKVGNVLSNALNVRKKMREKKEKRSNEKRKEENQKSRVYFVRTDFYSG